jgi:hypothetical protein
MKSIKSALAVTELLLVFPAVLFMAALFVRNLQPQQYEPAHSAQRIVDWYAASPHVGLWLLLIALPLTVLVMGTFTVRRAWKTDANLCQSARQLADIVRAHIAMALVSLASLAAAGILAIVALHLMAG